MDGRRYIPKCVVANCRDQTSSRYRFPVKTEKVKQIWLDRISNVAIRKYTDAQLYNRVFLCGAHFLDVCKGKKKLAERALPTINMPGFDGEINVHNSFYNEFEASTTMEPCTSSDSCYEDTRSTSFVQCGSDV